MRRKESVLVAMSGGVDSSVAAALLAREGLRVEGVTFRMYAEDPAFGGAGRAAERDAEDARRAARLLGIGHRVIDLKEDFQRHVIRPFLSSYSLGLTPVPCLACNRHVKFAALLRCADELGADTVATGHYAAVRSEGGKARLCRPSDLRRDQTYFLYDLPHEMLARLRLPLGDMRKEEIRSLAAELGLEVAGKPASREVCFIGANGDKRTRRYLGFHLPERPGPILDSCGRRLGVHSGIHFFTVGQRRGLGLAGGGPLHVLALDRERNAVVVGPPEELYASSCLVGDLRWNSPPDPEEEVEVRIRSRQPGVKARFEALGERRARIAFAKPQRAVTPGQAAVFYSGREVRGGGLIAAAERRPGRRGSMSR